MRYIECHSSICILDHRSRVYDDIAEIVGGGGESEQSAQQSEEMGGLTADSDWHALSQKEEADLETIMSQCDFAISNAEKFSDQLSRDLSVLDGVCVFVCAYSKDGI